MQTPLGSRFLFLVVLVLRHRSDARTTSPSTADDGVDREHGIDGKKQTCGIASPIRRRRSEVRSDTPPTESPLLVSRPLVVHNAETYSDSCCQLP